MSWQDHEDDLAEKIGLDKTPGSGALPWRKLDLDGRGTKWSLKFTEKESFRVSHDMIREAEEHTFGLGGGGEIPMWAVRLQNDQHDFVIMQLDDFLTLFREGVKLAKGKKSEERRRLASVPILLRDDDESTS